MLYNELAVLFTLYCVLYSVPYIVYATLDFSFIHRTIIIYIAKKALEIFFFVENTNPLSEYKAAAPSMDFQENCGRFQMQIEFA